MSGLFFNHISLDEILYVKVGTRPKYLKSRLIGAFSGYAPSFILMDDYDTRREKAQASSGGQQVWLLPNSFIRFVNSSGSIEIFSLITFSAMFFFLSSKLSSLKGT